MVWAWCYVLPIELALLAFVGLCDFWIVVPLGVILPLFVFIASRDLSFQILCHIDPEAALCAIRGLAIELLEKLDVDVDDLDLA